MRLRQCATKPSVQSVAAFLTYQAFALQYFGLHTLRGWSSSYIGLGQDPPSYMWFLVWWPYALTHGLNPFITKLVWAPGGANLLWSLSIPLPALVAYPVTKLFGPIFAHNVLCILALPLNALAAFILYRYLCSRFWPSLLAGYLFGFSTYAIAETLSHLPLLLLWPIPLGVYLVVRRVRGEIRWWRFVALTALLIVVEFLCCNEFVGTAAVIGALTMLVALAFTREDLRNRLWRTSWSIVCAFTLATLLLTPLLYYAFAFGFPHGSFYLPSVGSNDLLNFIIPTPATVFGDSFGFQSLARRFTSNYSEESAYVGPLLLLAVLWYSLEQWYDPRTKILTISFVLVCLASLGPTLHIAGKPGVTLPWTAMVHLPLVDKVLPQRLMPFAFLALGAMMTFFLTKAQHLTTKWILAILGTLLLIPNPGRGWSTTLKIPPFFSDGTYRRYLTSGETIVALPYAYQGNSMLWQALSQMYFSMAGGWVNVPPSEFTRWPIVGKFFDFANQVTAPEMQLKAFLGAHGVTTIVLTPGIGRPWRPLLSRLDSTSTAVGGVELYHVSHEVLARYHEATAISTIRQINAMYVRKLLIGANRYCSSGLDASTIELWKVQLAGFLSLPGSANAVISQDDSLLIWANFWLESSRPSNDVGVGMLGRLEDFATIVGDFGPFASEILFVLQHQDPLGATLPEGTGRLVIRFKPDGLARASELAQEQEKQQVN
jgi:hypothetical protein